MTIGGLEMEKNLVDIWINIQEEINKLGDKQRDVERKIEDWIKENFSGLYECLGADIPKGVDVPRYITIDTDNLPNFLGAFLYNNGKEIDKLNIPSDYVGKTLSPSKAIKCSEFLSKSENKKKIINYINE